jgi:hypothetical protein
MLLIVTATGVCGFLFSFFLLKAGVSSMALRYPLAVGLAYLVFLTLLRLWLHCQTTGTDPVTNSDDFSVVDDVLDMPDIESIPDHGAVPTDGSAADALGALDPDELFFVVLALAAICAGLLVCLYVVWTGPALLAEVLVDGLVMSRVYRRMKLAGQAYSMSGALRRTWLPVLFVAVFFAVAGFAMQKIDPDAKSIGPVLAHVLGKEL